MSQSCDYVYAVYNEQTRKARKLHKCDACGLPIKPGDYYCHVFTAGNGDVESYKRCGPCQATHLHLRKLCQSPECSIDRLWPDERLNCGLAYEDEWGDLPDEIAALAFLSDSERGALLKPGCK